MLNIKTNGKLAVGYSLEDGINILAHGFLTCENSADKDFFVNGIEFWSDETPKLYDLFVFAGNEWILLKVGFKTVEIKNRVVLVNGKPIKIKGVNRHDSHPEKGYAVSYDDFVQDLYIMKQNNINAVRTSHYPNDPRFYCECDRLGLYVIDEADFETHGKEFANAGLDGLSDSEEWQSNYLDRAEKLFERDKNHTLMGEYIKSRGATHLSTTKDATGYGLEIVMKP